MYGPETETILPVRVNGSLEENCLNPDQPQCWRIYSPSGVSPSLQSGEARGNIVAQTVSLRGRDGGATAELGDEVGNCLRASSGGGDKPYVLAQMAVRRLTPRECERLQGFPDDYTLTPYRGKPAADGPRYKALGNSWCINNVRWIGERIRQVDQIMRKTA